MGLADHETVSERGGQTSEIVCPMYRDRTDIEVDLPEAKMRCSTRWRGRCRIEEKERFLSGGWTNEGF